MNWFSLILGALALFICVPPLLSRKQRKAHEDRYRRQMAGFIRWWGWDVSETCHWPRITTLGWIVGGTVFGLIFLIGGLIG